MGKIYDQREELHAINKNKAVSRKSECAGSASLFAQHERWTADRWKVMFQVGMLKFSIGAECSDKQQAERLRDDFSAALGQLGINLPNAQISGGTPSAGSNCSALNGGTRMNWIPTAEKQHPDKPGLARYEQIPCLVVYHGEICIRQWNCEHLVWDEEDGDDFCCRADEVTHWVPLPPMPNVTGEAEEKQGEQNG